MMHCAKHLRMNKTFWLLLNIYFYAILCVIKVSRRLLARPVVYINNKPEVGDNKRNERSQDTHIGGHIHVGNVSNLGTKCHNYSN